MEIKQHFTTTTRAEAVSNRGPYAYQSTALPQGQTGSPINTLYTYKYGYNNVRQLGLVKDREDNISDTRNQTLHRGIVSLKMTSLPISMTPKTKQQQKSTPMKQEHQLVSNPLQNLRALCKLIQYGIVEYTLETFKFMCRLCSFVWNKPSSLLCNFENKMEENAGVGGSFLFFNIVTHNCGSISYRAYGITTTEHLSFPTINLYTV